MVAQSEVDRIKGNISNTYAVLEGYGAEMPQAMNTNNLPETVLSIKSVRYDEQTLTEEQKAQARENIGAATVEDVLDALPVYNGEVESL